MNKAAFPRGLKQDILVVDETARRLMPFVTVYAPHSVTSFASILHRSGVSGTRWGFIGFFVHFYRTNHIPGMNCMVQGGLSQEFRKRKLMCICQCKRIVRAYFLTTGWFLFLFLFRFLHLVLRAPSCLHKQARLAKSCCHCHMMLSPLSPPLISIAEGVWQRKDLSTCTASRCQSWRIWPVSRQE